MEAQGTVICGDQCAPPCPPAHWPRIAWGGDGHPARHRVPVPHHARFAGRIGLLDVPVDNSHPALREAQLVCRDFVARIPERHGTIAATALVGRMGRWCGLLPRATLFAAGVLGAGNPSATARAVAQGLAWLDSMEVEVLLMPFGHGFVHRGLDERMARLDPSRVLYAAAGNHGPDTLLFPASHPMVTAVSAITPDGRISGTCCARPEVELLAPDTLWVPGFADGGWLHGSSAACVLAVAELTAKQLAK